MSLHISNCELTGLVINSQLMQTFGQHLTRWREERCLTQAEIARLLEVSPTHISNLERDLSPSARKEGKPPQIPREFCDTIAEKLGLPQAEVYIAAGYLPPNSAPEDFRGIRLLGYFDQLPEPTQDDAVTIIEALWRRHASRTDAPAGDTAPLLELVPQIGERGDELPTEDLPLHPTDEEIQEILARFEETLEELRPTLYSGDNKSMNDRQWMLFKRRRIQEKRAELLEKRKIE